MLLARLAFATIEAGKASVLVIPSIMALEQKNKSCKSELHLDLDPHVMKKNVSDRLYATAVSSMCMLKLLVVSIPIVNIIPDGTSAAVVE